MGYKKHIYLAAPFFNQEQKQTIEKMENLTNQKEFLVYSPRIECVCPPNASLETRESVFKMNLKAIKNSDIILANIDDFDPGTIFEMGYAFSKEIPIVAYTSKDSGRGLNLMLAQSCYGFVKGFGKMKEFLEKMSTLIIPNLADVKSFRRQLYSLLESMKLREWNGDIE